MNNKNNIEYKNKEYCSSENIEQPTIKVSSMDMVSLYEQEIDEILEVIGHSEAFVTDESRLSDFDMFGEFETQLTGDIENHLNVTCNIDDYLIDIAEKMRNKHYE